MTDAVYLDHASSTPLSPAALEALQASTSASADPLLSHTDARAARAVLEDARDQIAAGIGAQADEIVFTSGGWESVTLAIVGAARARRAHGARIVVSTVEHPSVFGAAEYLGADGFEVVQIPVDSAGRIDAERFMMEVRKPGTTVASVQHANHEVGSLQPIAECARHCRAAGVTFHTDAAQTVGQLPIDVASLDVDLLSISGHKFGAPAGIGALYLRRGVPLTGFPTGDSRERHRRSGAENVLGAAAMGAALAEALGGLADAAATRWMLTDSLRTGLGAIDGVIVHGHPTQRAPHLVGFSVHDVDAEVLLMALDDRGFAISCGCPARGLVGETSGVLEAMGIQQTVSYRVSVGRGTTTADIEGFLGTIGPLVGELQTVERATRESLGGGR